MTALSSIIREAQEALESYQPATPDPVEVARAFFGADAWFEVDRFRATGELPESVRGLELLQIEIELDEKV